MSGWILRHGMMKEHGPISSSYNGRRAVSETDNEGPIPSPEAGYSTGKWSDNDDFGITPFLGPNR